MNVAPVRRRVAPTDRRSPVTIARGACPVGQGCYCCPNAGFPGHGRSQRACLRSHPEADRMCSPPYPPTIAPCLERSVLPADPPVPPAGSRPLPFAVCVDCGRVTARRWTDSQGRVLAWCAGDFPTFTGGANDKEGTR